VLIDGLPLEAPAAPLGDLPRVGLDAGPDEPALVSATRSMSWRELEEESERLAGGYRSLGLEAGDDEMPLNPTGKIDRTGLKRMAEDHLHPHGL
jgi:acyl-CoA synthetase (AMP-forming)/AMP-acid ligase II